MSKTIKVIDLLNKIANGEEFPKIIKIDYITYKWNKSENRYCRQDVDYVSLSFGTNNLNDEVEIIEEQQDIDIQKIDDLPKWVTSRDGEVTQQEGKRLEMAYKINELVQAVKQLDKKIKEER